MFYTGTQLYIFFSLFYKLAIGVIKYNKDTNELFYLSIILVNIFHAVLHMI